MQRSLVGHTDPPNNFLQSRNFREDDDGGGYVDAEDGGGDDDIYIMVECILYVCYKKVTTSWIVGDDDMYIMVECILYVTKK